MRIIDIIDRSYAYAQALDKEGGIYFTCVQYKELWHKYDNVRLKYNELIEIYTKLTEEYNELVEKCNEQICKDVERYNELSKEYNNLLTAAKQVDKMQDFYKELHKKVILNHYIKCPSCNIKYKADELEIEKITCQDCGYEYFQKDNIEEYIINREKVKNE